MSTASPAATLAPATAVASVSSISSVSSAPSAPFAAVVAAYAPGAIPAAIGSLFGGGIYAGVIRGVAGVPDQHLVLIDQEAVGVNWDAAVAFAAAAGGELPTRREQALLFANLPEKFTSNWYWSGEQSGPSTAWRQSFYYGYQNDDYRSYEGRARAVRRLPI